MKIGELAQRLGTTERTLRFYEEEGLVHPARSGKGTRSYSEADAQRLEAILTLTQLDFPLQTLKELAGIRRASRSGDEASHKVHAQLEIMGELLKQQIQTMRKVQKDLQKAQQLVTACFGCKRKANLKNCTPCEFSRGVTNTNVMRVVWDEQH